MKKLFLLGVVALIGASTMTSCKKYSCTIGSNETTYKDVDKSDADNMKAACEAVGGTWKRKL